MKVSDILNVARFFLGYNEHDGSFKQIVDIYNSHRPLAVGYIVKYSDDWCDTFVSAVAIKAGAVDLIGTECGCERHVRIWQNMGIWHEDGNEVPMPGDIIVYNWDDRTQPNNGFSDHVGFVESVQDGMIHTIEGNRTAGTGVPAVRRMQVRVGHGQIRGFARPLYEDESHPIPNKTAEEVAKEVVFEGKWGNGADRKRRLEDAGYDYDEVQREINKILNTHHNDSYTIKQFVMDVQEAIGARVDGIPGSETLRKTPTLSAAWNARHPAVKPVQKRLAELGYGSVGNADGIAGWRFTKAVKEFQRDHNCYADGEITSGNKTWKKLLEMI